MLTVEQEIELLISILQTIEDEQQYARIASHILELNASAKNQQKTFNHTTQHEDIDRLIRIWACSKTIKEQF